jgi:hypothetical protein
MIARLRNFKVRKLLPRFLRKSLLTLGSDGMSLVEVMIAAFLIAFASVAVATTIANLTKSEQKIGATFARDELLQMLRAYGGRPTLIAWSALRPENKQLADCLSGIDGVKCISLEVYSLSLIVGANAESAISGSPDVPRRYTLQGQPCPLGTPASFRCPLEVSTSFFVQCKPAPFTLLPAPTCPGQTPEVIEIVYEVTVTNDPVIEQNIKASGFNIRDAWGSIVVEL